MLCTLASEWNYALSQKLESATAVHLPFDQLEPVHLSFNLSIAPALFHRCQHRVVVPMDSGDEAHDFGDVRQVAGDATPSCSHIEATFTPVCGSTWVYMHLHTANCVLTSIFHSRYFLYPQLSYSRPTRQINGY